MVSGRGRRPGAAAACGAEIRLQGRGRRAPRSRTRPSLELTPPLYTPPPSPPDPTRPKGVVDVAKEAARDSWRVFRHPVWVLMVAGYTMYAAVIGTYAFWGPKAGKEIYHMKVRLTFMLGWLVCWLLAGLREIYHTKVRLVGL